MFWPASDVNVFITSTAWLRAAGTVFGNMTRMQTPGTNKRDTQQNK